MPSEVKFGFLCTPMALSWSEAAVAPVPDFEALVSGIRSSPGVFEGWIYPPSVPVHGREAARVNAAYELGQYSLPPSHTLTMKPGVDPTKADFFIALIGLMKGLRLQRDGWTHFYKAPLDSKLCDFVAGEGAISWVLDLASDFLNQNPSPDVLRMAFGALHWHLFAQLYEHEFERFDAQYKALDACYRLAVLTDSTFSKQGGHAGRALGLCTHLRIEAPDWVKPLNGINGDCELSVRRNALAHEAMYGGATLGFAHPGDSGAMNLGLKSLVARIFLKVLGVHNEYTGSSSTTRQLHLFAKS